MAHSRVEFWPALVVAVCLSACGRADSSRSADTTRVAEPKADSAIVSGVWPEELGPMLVVPADTESLAVVLYPVRATVPVVLDSGVALVSTSGDVVRRRVGLGAPDSLHCGGAPLAHLSRPTPLTWAIGIQGTTATPLRTDSIDALTPADSSAHAAEMARLASTVNANQASRFTGLPFSLATLRRFRIGDREVIVAQVVRRLNQEAEPGEERTLVIAEGASAAGKFTLVFGGRSDGGEDEADHFDMLAALRTSKGTLVIMARERPAATTFDILERDATGAWRVRWSRSIAC